MGRTPSPSPSEGDLFDPPAEAPQPVTLSAGFSALLHANKNGLPVTPAAAAPRAPRRPTWTVSLVAADALFIVLAIMLVQTASPVWYQWLLCALALGMGAWLSILAWVGRAE